VSEIYASVHGGRKGGQIRAVGSRKAQKQGGGAHLTISLAKVYQSNFEEIKSINLYIYVM
jgi:hypothetical protein